MVDVLTEITINKPIANVAEYASNPANAPEWYENIRSAEYVRESPSGKGKKQWQVGSKIAFKAQFLGRQLEYIYEITDYIPCEKLTMRTAEGPFPMETTYTWKSVNNEQTRMTLRNTGRPSGFSKLFAPFMAVMMKKANNKDLQKIKTILESNY